MKAKVYIETSIVSYLTARPSRDVVQAAHQKLTRTWWEGRAQFSLFVSEVVLREASAGDPKAAARRLNELEGVAVLGVSEEATNVAEALLLGGGLPRRAELDAFHIAVAAAHGMDFLLTWNCKHIANATMRGKIEKLCRSAGFEPPIICTPEELQKEV
jgi:predicted nucleic acid-binding protein